MKNLFRLCVVLLPWGLRRHVLRWIYGYQIHPTARIGFSWIFPAELAMGSHARIGHLNVAVNLRRIEMAAHTCIDRSNWITGYPAGDRRHFSHHSDRDPVLILAEHSAITKRHLLDCTHRITIGAFTTIAGYASQLMTHAIDLEKNRQDAAPIHIGDRCFVGTAVVILGGARLPARSVLGAKAMLNKPYDVEGQLYAGVPAKPVRSITGEYFNRSTGFVS